MIFDDKKYIAKKIKEYRQKRGLTQAELAEKIDIGTKQISRLEVGDFYPSLSTFLKIVETLDMDINDFSSKISSTENKIRTKLVKILYNATENELNFYDRLLTFAIDETAELKKNILMKNIK